jgi:hypothetical protein
MTETAENHEGTGGAPRPLDFSTYLMSLGTSALVQMGEAPDPSSGAAMPCDLQGARQTIDLLALLEVKTEGNRTAKEDALLRGLLRDLRVRWVRAAKRNRC